MYTITQESLNIIKKRPLNSHKGNFGKIVTVGGSLQYGGAILLSTSSAIYAGAGLVTCATNLSNLTALHTLVPEAMFINFYDVDSLSFLVSNCDVCIIGPGLPLDELGLNILKTVLLSARHSLIIDGSAITLLAQNKELLNIIKASSIIFTPHQMEWERLSGIQISKQTPNQNRLFQSKLSATIVLKKFHTEIYHTDNSVGIINIGGPYMATGGMGDTLTGIIAAFIAQFKNIKKSVDGAVFIHSKIAQELSKTNYVVLPSDIIKNLQRAMLKK